MHSISKVHGGLRFVIIEQLRKTVRPETGWALKSGQRIANKGIGQQQPVDCVKQSRCVWCQKNTTKRVALLRVQSAITRQLLLALSCNGLGKITPSCCRCVLTFCDFVLTLISKVILGNLIGTYVDKCQHAFFVCISMLL